MTMTRPILSLMTLAAALLFAAPRGALPCISGTCAVAGHAAAESESETPKACCQAPTRQTPEAPTSPLTPIPCECPPGCPSVCGAKIFCTMSSDITRIIREAPPMVIPDAAQTCPANPNRGDVFHPPRA